jgi:hypothetical protein
VAPVDKETLQREPALAEIVRRLVDAYRPHRIYLFGSIARGERGPDSDYDLMVVVPDDAEPHRLGSGLAYQALRACGGVAAGDGAPRGEAPPCRMIRNWSRRRAPGC